MQLLSCDFITITIRTGKIRTIRIGKTYSLSVLYSYIIKNITIFGDIYIRLVKQNIILNLTLNRTKYKSPMVISGILSCSIYPLQEKKFTLPVHLYLKPQFDYVCRFMNKYVDLISWYVKEIDRKSNNACFSISLIHPINASIGIKRKIIVCNVANVSKPKIQADSIFYFILAIKFCLT